MKRLQRFRAFMERMNPTADPRRTIQDGLCVTRPDGDVWSDLKKSLELEPAATHLVLGGIGSGKTTQLLLASEALRGPLDDVGDHVEYCDVSTHHHLEASQSSGILIALAGRLLQRGVRWPRDTPGEVRTARESLKRFADGFTEWIEYDPHQPDDDSGFDDGPDPSDGPFEYPEYRPGVLKPPPTATLPYNLRQRANDLQVLVRHRFGPDRSVLLFLDALDRLPKPETFVTMVQHDLRILKQAGIGTVVVGPIRYVVGDDRGLAELFDHTHFQLDVDPRNDTGAEFLSEILRRRDVERPLLSTECIRELALASGGKLRDLLTLAKRAAEDAYTDGRDEVTIEDVAHASDAMGRSLAIGLDDAQIKQLKKVDQTGKLVFRTALELSLLETRRVILYKDNRCVVHPALAPVLGLIPEGV